MKVLIDKATRAVLTLNPPTDAEGTVVLPFGIDVEVAEISGVDAARFGQFASYALAADGTLVVTPAPPDPAAAAKAVVLPLAQSAVGVALTSLTANQQRALLACLLYKVGALDANLTVLPPAQWLS